MHLVLIMDFPSYQLAHHPTCFLLPPKPPTKAVLGPTLQPLTSFQGSDLPKQLEFLTQQVAPLIQYLLSLAQSHPFPPFSRLSPAKTQAASPLLARSKHLGFHFLIGARHPNFPLTAYLRLQKTLFLLLLYLMKEVGRKDQRFTQVLVAGFH